MMKDQHELKIERDLERVDMMSEPDPDWSYVDKAGHEHNWNDEITWPTLIWIQDAPTEGECLARFHYECCDCGEHIIPGMRASRSETFLPGCTHYLIDNVEVTAEELCLVAAEELEVWDDLPDLDRMATVLTQMAHEPDGTPSNRVFYFEWLGEEDWPVAMSWELERNAIPAWWAMMPWKLRKIAIIPNECVSIYVRIQEVQA